MTDIELLAELRTDMKWVKEGQDEINEKLDKLTQCYVDDNREHEHFKVYGKGLRIIWGILVAVVTAVIVGLLT